MKNRLISDEMRRAYPSVSEHRSSGRSTAMALRYISEALLSPNTPIRVRDHHDNLHADKYLLVRCQDIVEKMGLQFFAFSKEHRTIQCNLFENPN